MAHEPLDYRALLLDAHMRCMMLQSQEINIFLTTLSMFPGSNPSDFDLRGKLERACWHAYQCALTDAELRMTEKKRHKDSQKPLNSQVVWTKKKQREVTSKKPRKPIWKALNPQA